MKYESGSAESKFAMNLEWNKKVLKRRLQLQATVSVYTRMQRNMTIAYDRSECTKTKYLVHEWGR